MLTNLATRTLPVLMAGYSGGDAGVAWGPMAAASAPNRFGVGITGKQGPSLVPSFAPCVFSSGGHSYNARTGEISVNRPQAVAASEFYASLFRDELTPPEVTTWEFDEIIAGGQADRCTMAATFAPYGTLLDDPQRSRTAGRWAWALIPGATDIAQSTTTLGGWTFAVPKSGARRNGRSS